MVPRLVRQDVCLGERAAARPELYGERAWSPDDRIEPLLFVGGQAELQGARLSGRLDVEPDVIVEAATRHYLATAHR